MKVAVVLILVALAITARALTAEELAAAEDSDSYDMTYAETIVMKNKPVVAMAMPQHVLDMRHCDLARSAIARHILSSDLLREASHAEYAFPTTCPFAPASDPMSAYARQRRRIASGALHKCDLCGKTFGSLWHLDRHQLRMHAALVPATARVCLADYCALLDCEGYVRANPTVAAEIVSEQWAQGQPTTAGSSTRTPSVPAPAVDFPVAVPFSPSAAPTCAGFDLTVCHRVLAQCFPPGVSRAATRLHSIYAPQICDAHRCAHADDAGAGDVTTGRGADYRGSHSTAAAAGAAGASAAETAGPTSTSPSKPPELFGHGLTSRLMAIDAADLSTGLYYDPHAETRAVRRAPKPQTTWDKVWGGVVMMVVLLVVFAYVGMLVVYCDAMSLGTGRRDRGDDKWGSMGAGVARPKGNKRM